MGRADEHLGTVIESHERSIAVRQRVKAGTCAETSPASPRCVLALAIPRGILILTAVGIPHTPVWQDAASISTTCRRQMIIPGQRSWYQMTLSSVVCHLPYPPRPVPEIKWRAGEPTISRNSRIIAPRPMYLSLVCDSVVPFSLRSRYRRDTSASTRIPEGFPTHRPS